MGMRIGFFYRNKAVVNGKLILYFFSLKSKSEEASLFLGYFTFCFCKKYFKYQKSDDIPMYN